MDSRRRLHWVDIARGFFIIAIVLGHVLKGGYLRLWVFSFHVPAFFFLSGYCFIYTEDIKTFLKKKVQTIVVPYFVFSILSIVLFAMAKVAIPRIGTILECNPVVNIFTMLYGNSKPNTMKYNLPLWFLTCFFSVTVLAYFIEFGVKKIGNGIRYLAMLAGAIMGVFVAMNDTLALPWHLETAASMLVWYIIGITVREKEEIICAKVKYHNLKPVLQTIGANLLIFFWGGISFLNIRTVGVRNDHYGIIFIYYVGAVLGIAGFIWLSMIIEKNKVLEFIGINSLAILVMHKFPVLVFQELITATSKMLNHPNSVLGLLCGAIVLVVSIGISLVAGQIIGKICPWVLGSKKKT